MGARAARLLKVGGSATHCEGSILCNPDESLLSQPITFYSPSLATDYVQVFDNISKENFPDIKKVTSISTVCESVNSSEAFKDLLPTVHQLLLLFLTLPITSATSERHFLLCEGSRHTHILR